MIEEQLKNIKSLGFQYRRTKDNKTKENVEKELKEILFQLKKDAISKFKNESDIKTFLDNIIKFNNYSYNNQLLIYLQKPSASYVTSFSNIKKMGYMVNKGASSIKIFIPYFLVMAKISYSSSEYELKPFYTLSKDEKNKYFDQNDNSITKYKDILKGFSLGNVFDVNDTSIPMDIINNELNPILVDKKADEIIDCFIKTIYNDGFKVKFAELDGTKKGYCDHKNNEIVIKKNLGNLMQLKVLIHEYGHALAHKHLKDNYQEYQDNRNKYETEAESISYVVSKYLGMDTSNYSLSYLYAWSKEKDFKEIDNSLNTIVNYSKRIIKNFEKFYNKELSKITI